MPPKQSSLQLQLSYVSQENGPETPIVVSSAFQNGLALFATGVPLYAGIDAIFGKGQRGDRDCRWESENYGSYQVATYRYTTGRGGVQPVEPYGPLDGARLGGDLGWALVQEVGIRTAFIHLILAAYAMELADPTRDRFIVTAKQLAEYLGYTGRARNRKHVALPELLADMEEEMRLVSAWGITIRQVQVHTQQENPNGKRKRTPFTIKELEDRLWDIAVAREYQGYLEDPEHGELRNVAWSVRPGQWAAYFLSPGGMRQWGLLAQAVLQIDPYHQPLAAKLAVYLQLQGRIRLAKGQPLEYQVIRLLAAIHELPQPQPGQSNDAIRQARSRKRR